MFHNNLIHSMVINYPKENELYDLVSLIRDSCSDFIYYGIVHDKDIDAIGDLKRKHIHLILKSKKKIRSETIISNIVDMSKGVMCAEQFSDRVCADLSLAIQYLTHKNDSDKYQYSYDNIFTNDLEGLEIEYNKEKELDVDRLTDIIMNCKNKIQIVKTIGYDNYMKYRYIINWVWDERNY